MKKNFLIIIVMVISLMTFTGCSKSSMSDNMKFKNEYESINGKISEHTKKENRSIKIPKDNPMVYATAEDIVKKVNNKETFVIYFGFAECPWCRSVVSTLIDVANDLGLDKIYYVDVKDIRDELEVLDDSSISTKVKGNKDYMELLKLFDNVLEDYTLTDKDNNDVSTNEKRIYAPNVISVVNGKAQEMDSGISKKQNNPYMKITEKMRKETYNKFKCIIKCVVEASNSCSNVKC